jgi:hypothetical protein
MINVEMANDLEVVQDGRTFIEKVNALFLAAGSNGSEFRAGIERWPVLDSADQQRCCAGIVPRRSRNGLNSDIARGPRWPTAVIRSPDRRRRIVSPARARKSGRVMRSPA